MYKLYLACKFFFARRINVISVVGIAVGVWLLTVVPSVMNGFLHEQRDLIRGTLSDIVLTPHPVRGKQEEGRYPPFERYQEALKGIAHVEAAAPRIVWVALIGTSYGNRLLSSSQWKSLNVVQIVGVDPALEAKASKFGEYLRNHPLKHGDPVVDPAKPFDLPMEEVVRLYGEEERYLAQHAVVLPEPLLGALDLVKGQRLVLQTMVFPEGKADLKQSQEVSRKFYVAGTLRTGEYEVDIPKIFMSLEAAREMIGASERDFTEIVVRLDDYRSAGEAREGIDRELAAQGLPCDVETWEEQRHVLLRAVNNEKVIINTLLSSVILVGVAIIFVILSLVVSQKIRDIGVLLALGGTRRGIVAIFLGMGALTCVFGELIGGVAGYYSVKYLTPFEMFLRDRLGIVLFDPKVYAFQQLPAAFEWSDFLILLAGTFLACLLASLLPAWRAARLDPVEALRYE